MKYFIYPIICNGYHLIEPVYIEEGSIPGLQVMTSFPYADSEEAAKGWESTTHFKFNGDGKRVVWLCPECAKRWNEEKQDRISSILDMANKVEFLPKQLSLYNELLVLGATKEQKYEFDRRILEAERGYKTNIQRSPKDK